jgi:hypothetical protein
MGFRQAMNTRRPKQPEFVLQLRAIPGSWQAPPEQRLRGLLKVALRAFGFRCEVYRPKSEPAQAVKPPGSEPPNAPATR